MENVRGILFSVSMKRIELAGFGNNLILFSKSVLSIPRVVSHKTLKKFKVSKL
jgi:hypothetical protein